MPTRKSILAKTKLGVIIVVLVGCLPLSVSAEVSDTSEQSSPAAVTPPTLAPAPETEPSPQPSPPTPTPAPAPAPDEGPAQPTGADSNKYHYNADTGLWESEKYIWNPATNQTSPKIAPDYSYNPDTDRWDTTKWVYDPGSGKYVAKLISVEEKPAGAPEVPLSTLENGLIGNQSTTTSGLIGPDVYNDINHSNDSRQIYDLYYNAAISNVINSNALTGNASIDGNTFGGSALSGDALAIANIINILQSSWSPQDGDLATFVSNIYGDVYGDLLIDPGAISSGTACSTCADNLDINVNYESNGQITNDVSLAAQTGNVRVDSNTTGGDASSGNATAVANVINMINSAIASGKSFMGMLNIYGSLEGDVLLPPDVLNNLLASNAPITALKTSQVENSEILAEFKNNQNINNNVLANAESGGALVNNNTKAGNATSGNAETNVTILNLTGRQVIGGNALLVFVNVLGEWVGMIVNAPEGATAAALGNGSNLCACQGNLDIDATNNNTINNYIDVKALTGDASVTNNTTAGNATTGDALATVNLLNIINTQFSLTDWFGILFINVFGSWRGSFGVDTAMGNPIIDSPSASPTPDHVKVFKFVPTSTHKHRLEPVELAAAGDTETALPTEDSGTSGDNSNIIGATTGGPTDGSSNFWFPFTGVSIGIALLALERYLAIRDKQKHSRKLMFFSKKDSTEFIQPLGSH